MNGETAQAAALVAHGNAWLAELAKPSLREFEANNSTFQFVRHLNFELQGARRSGNAGSVQGWIKHLKKSGIDRLWLLAGGSARAEAFVGTNRGLWGQGKRGVEAWHSEWSVNRSGVAPSDVKASIWEVRYASSFRQGTAETPPFDVTSSEQELTKAAEEAKALSIEEPALSTFTSWFAEAIDMRSQDAPTPPWNSDVLPSSGYPPDARRLLAMATRCWVFGGMGSWNDYMSSDHDLAERYGRVSGRLHDAVMRAIRDSVHAFDPAAA